MTDPELKPCPNPCCRKNRKVTVYKEGTFSGSQNKEVDRKYWVIECGACHLTVGGGLAYIKDKQFLLEFWNAYERADG